MLSPQFKNAITDVINNEAKLSIVEIEAMGKIQKMGWHGFKRMFGYRASDRFKHLKMMKKCINDYGDENIPLVINYTAPNDGSTFSAILLYMKDESEKQIDRLKTALNVAYSDNETMIGCKLEYMIKDQEMENKKLNRVLKGWDNANKMNNVGNWMFEYDHFLHEKYKSKMKKY